MKVTQEREREREKKERKRKACGTSGEEAK
jgi:hypothetical protein